MKDKDSKCRAKKVLTAAKDALFYLDDSIMAVRQATEIIKKQQGDIIVTGIGKSGFIGQKIAATLTSLGQRASYLHSVEAAHGDIGMLSEGDTLLALSFSGESKEVVKITAYAKKHFEVPVIAFTRDKNSSLGKLADCCIEVKVDNEGSPDEMAPMASTTTTLVLGDMLAAMLTGNDFKKDSFARFHPGGSLGLKLKKVKDLMRIDKNLPIVKEVDIFSKVLKEIDSKKMGATGVVDSDNKLSGIITDGDIRRFFIHGKNIGQVQARDFMTKNPKHIKEIDSLEIALTKMEEYKITHLFAVNNQMKPVGVIHIHDIIENTFIQQ
jgi:arabinose-5-phosphate isomerase